ncbi:hypothetical protein BAZOLSSOX_2331 [uncultured Gammaproteobacteria bacterium]|nr:hypothetical protein BAZOLSSOX_370 [uncultured Gammaproteobacteria bacterium]VVH59317.1 hypothetical protein BAZOLSSOX_2313 [uncultured Gammaproteobacteria bacterium]VVH59722.1 hypothetical protein BAZOLSSOX_2331 [uncultured Gammaproteobacteria bacterium]
MFIKQFFWLILSLTSFSVFIADTNLSISPSYFRSFCQSFKQSNCP